MSLTDRRGNTSRGRLAIHMATGSTSIIAEVIEQAHMLEQTLSLPNITHLSDTTTNVADAVSSQTNLATSLSSLMDKVGVLVKLGDEISQDLPLISLSLLVPS